MTSRCTPSRTRAVDVTALSAQAVERRFLALRGLRWAPIGLMIPVMVLLLTERGFSLTEIGATAAAPGLMVLLLELPTGGLADALGRRPVLLLATAIDLVATALFVVTQTLALLIVVRLLQGVYRALEVARSTAMIVGAIVLALGAPLYLRAQLRHRHAAART